MTELRQRPEVTNLELFYDLIFAYAISRITTVLHLVHHEVIPGRYLLEYLIMFFMFWTIWTYQTVLVNRFFQENVQHSLFMIFDMFVVIILSQSLNPNFESTHPTFAGSTSILLFSIALQYWLRARHLHDEKQLAVAKGLARTLFISGTLGALTIIPWAPYLIRVTVYVGSMVYANVSPAFLKRALTEFPALFEHLTERYSLFTLLLFGEAIIAVASVVNVHHFNWLAIPFFLTIVALFLGYFAMYQQGIDRHQKTAGITLINVHYAIFVGLDLVTVAMELFLNGELIGWQFVGLVTLGLWGFGGGILTVLATYPKRGLRISLGKAFSWLTVGLVLLGGILMFIKTHVAVTMVLLAVVALCGGGATWQFLRQDFKQPVKDNA